LSGKIITVHTIKRKQNLSWLRSITFTVESILSWELPFVGSFKITFSKTINSVYAMYLTYVRGYFKWWTC